MNNQEVFVYNSDCNNCIDNLDFSKYWYCNKCGWVDKIDIITINIPPNHFGEDESTRYEYLCIACGLILGNSCRIFRDMWWTGGIFSKEDIINNLCQSCNIRFRCYTE